MTTLEALTMLGLRPWPAPTASDVREAYRRLAATAHPDAGGTTQQFSALTQARHAAMAYAVDHTAQLTHAPICQPCGGLGHTKFVHGVSSLRVVCQACGGSGKA